jgi:hypothetical protein
MGNTGTHAMPFTSYPRAMVTHCICRWCGKYAQLWGGGGGLETSTYFPTTSTSVALPLHDEAPVCPATRTPRTAPIVVPLNV